MKPTRPTQLLGLVVVFALLGYVVYSRAYGSLRLPAYAPVTLVLLTLVEGGMERVVRTRLAGRGGPRARPIEPMQVARAAVFAKASSVTGAILLGGYAGILVWALPRRDELVVAGHAAAVAGASVLASLALVVAALLLERACRVPSSRRD